MFDLRAVMGRLVPSLTVLMLIAACAPAATPAPPAAPANPAPAAPAPAAVATPTAAPAAPTPAPAVKKTGPLKIGVLAVVDMLPFQVAEDEGLWKNLGAQVELVSFRSAVERDTALTAGEIDAVYSDMISLGLVNKEKSATQAVLSI
ncbi:MAG: MetQ/NlpA family ABC transporter substrate-binding protein, partial [Chloroflexi bacterium]|nr:MetQ/NlpA family ABC transporter substrate-binding protein [Chloroflexota bacterium]